MPFGKFHVPLGDLPQVAMEDEVVRDLKKQLQRQGSSQARIEAGAWALALCPKKKKRVCQFADVESGFLGIFSQLHSPGSKS